MKYYYISGYVLCLSDFTRHLIWDRFDEFSFHDSTAHISFKLTSEPFENVNKIPNTAERVVNSAVNSTFRNSDTTFVLHTPDDVVSFAKANIDYSDFLLNVDPAYYALQSDPNYQGQMRDEVMIYMRKLLTGKLALDSGLCMHACVIDYDGNGILFSASTKTGKSTHAHLWREVFPGTEIINGDNGFCRVLDDCPFVFGAPWCGDSNEFMNKTLPVRAIVFIERAPENTIEKLSALDAFVRLSARCYMPFWDKALINKTMDTIEFMTQKVACYLLRCRPDRDAVRIAHHELFGT